MGFLDIFKAASIKEENLRLAAEVDALKQDKANMQAVFVEIGGPEVLNAKAKISEYEAQAESLRKEGVELAQCNEAARIELESKKKEILVADDALLFESFALYRPKFQLNNSTEYMERLSAIRDQQKSLIKAGAAVIADEGWTVNKSIVEGRKMVSDMKKLLLRAFNNECDYCVDNVKFNNIDAHAIRIEKTFEAVRKLGRILSASITDEYKQLKLDELHLAFEYQQKKQEEKEAQRVLREEIREQQKLEQEIRQAREKIAKEKKHFAIAIKALESKLADPGSAADLADIQQKLDEVRGQYSALEDEEKVIDYREQNAKAGYVYIISNIGSFGENVFKIGMTRRLEPQDRVDELGDASVPFRFDIHAMIFSENAPALESKLHSHFEKNRVNKINGRKEFFKADLAEIEAVLRENYDKVFDLFYEAPAEQYRESLLVTV